ncbi:MAG: acetyl-CoA acetyltransferase [Acidimicrobiales bacterium]
MPLDPRTPVIVGVGQVTRHPESVAESLEPAALMAEAARAAGEDARAPGLLGRADSVQVVEVMSLGYANAPLALATRIGASPRETVQSAVGGNSPQQLVNQASLDILAGRSDVVIIAGVEAIHSRHLAHRAGTPPPWGSQPPGTAPADRIVGIARPGTSDGELSRSLAAPVQIYPVFETALRLAAGETVDEHQRRVSALWATFSDVATRNPYAWDQRRHTAEEIRTPGPKNRWIGWPYTKLMVAYAGVDMSAALILTSVEAARAAGVPEDRWVFPWAGADCHDHWFVTERVDLCSSPAIAANGAAVMGLAGITIDDIAHIDLYSCFPSAVQMGAAALGLALDGETRPLTVTGGLSFCGGPLNDYVTHSLATMTEVLRADPASIGLVTALGWYCTKHSMGVYSTTPPPTEFRHAHPQAEVDASPSRQPAFDHAGPVALEAWSVMHERAGEPSLGLVACLTPEGRRTWANTRKPDLLAALETDELDGRSAELLPDGELDIR